MSCGEHSRAGRWINCLEVNFRDWKSWITGTVEALTEPPAESRGEWVTEALGGWLTQAKRMLNSGEVSVPEIANAGSEHILFLVNNISAQGFTATEEQWAGRRPIINQLFLQHSMRVQQDVYVLVAVGGYLQSIERGGPGGGLLWRLGHETTLDRSHRELALHWPLWSETGTYSPSTAINAIHIHTGKGKKLSDGHQFWVMIYLIAEMIVQRGDRYNFKDQLGILVPTNGLKKMLNDLLIAAKPFQEWSESLPHESLSLKANIRQVNGLSPLQDFTTFHVTQALVNYGWIFSGALVVSTTMAATGVTFLDSLWFKPYASAFTEKLHHSVVATSRAEGILVIATNVNTVRNYNKQFITLAVKLHGLRVLGAEEAIGAETKQVEQAVAAAVQHALYSEPYLFDPQRLGEVRFDRSGYQGAHAILNADLDLSTITWERLPQLLALRVILREITAEGPLESYSERIIWLRPVIRVQHNDTGQLATPFHMGGYAVWIYEQIMPYKDRVDSSRTHYSLVRTRTRQGATLLRLYRNRRRVAGHLAPGSRQLVLDQFRIFDPKK